MADALMNWEAGRTRWRKKYKGVWLQISAADLGGTTATDTTVAANRWYREQQARIDREKAKTTYRPYELEYEGIQENIKTEMTILLTILRANPTLQSAIMPVLENFKQRDMRITRILQQQVLPPPDDSVRNPLHITPGRIEGEAFRDARQLIANQIREQGTIRVSREEWKDIEGYIPHDHPHLGIDDSVYSDYDSNSEFYKRMNLINGHNSNLAERTLDERIQTEASRVVGLKDELLAGKKKEQGLIESEYERGQINQMLQEAGATVPESRKLDYHIDQFIEHQQRRHATKKITAGRFGKIVNTLKRYKEWAGNINVEKIGTRNHIAAYHRSLEDLVIADKIKPEYANNLFGTFRMLVLWLAKADVFKEYPHWLLDNGKDYAFPVERKKPMTVPLEWVHKVLNASNPRLKLCILLTLNCGFGASEIGQLEKDEYNPVKGRITHKRCKVKDSPNAPTVCYKLWNETRELLDQEIENRKNYPKHSETVDCLLVNSNGKPLWYEYVADGKSSRSNNISTDFKRLLDKLRKDDSTVPKITYYQFRRTSASLIYNEHKYRMYNELWLAHSPRSVADRHYNALDDTILDDCIDWLHARIFSVESPSVEVEALKNIGNTV
jgi:integrase